MIYTICQERNTDNIDNILHVINNIIDHIWPNEKICVIIVNNAIKGNKILRYNDYVTMITSNNNCWEFSAFDTGYKFFKKKYIIKDDDIIIFANETITRNYNKNFNILFYNRKIKKWVKKYIVGIKGYYVKKRLILDNYVKSYFSTHLFILNKKNADILFPFTPLINDEVIFNNNPRKIFNDNIPIDFKISENIIKKITYNINDKTIVKHHNVINVNNDNIEYVIGKSKTIIAEKYLGAKANKNKIKIKNINKYPSVRMIMGYLADVKYTRIIYYIIKNICPSEYKNRTSK